MAIDTSLQGRDVYMRSTDEKGLVTHSQHRVWDADRFIAARQADAARLNAEATKKDPDHPCTAAGAQLITREQFKART